MQREAEKTKREAEEQKAKREAEEQRAKREFHLEQDRMRYEHELAMEKVISNKGT